MPGSARLEIEMNQNEKTVAMTVALDDFWRVPEAGKVSGQILMEAQLEQCLSR